MISWLQGLIVNIEDNEATLNVQGVGYQVTLGSNFLFQIKNRKEEVSLPIQTIVREDSIKLFGFDSFLSRKVFTILTNVNGVGPKTALNIVDQLNIEQIFTSVQNQEFSCFLKISGVGKKTAQKILIDLQEKLDFVENKENSASPKILKNESSTKTDAKSALVNLGFLERDAEKAVTARWDQSIPLNQLIRLCLADLSKHSKT